MVNSNGVGFMAVVAISGSVALITLQAHKRLVTEFMKKVEFEFGMEREVPKKKVRFADDVIEPLSKNKEYRMRHYSKAPLNMDQVSTVEVKNMNGDSAQEIMGGMPLNRLQLYKGMIKYRMLKGAAVPSY